MNKHSKYKLTSPIKFISHRDPKAREANLQKAREAKPSKCLHNSATIHWLNKRYGRNLVDKRVLSLLPNNGIPVENKCNSPEMKKRNKFKSWFKTYCHPKDKFEKLEINPKYLFTSETFKKILQLREIFLEFDEDGSRKMELDEMEEMFHKNKLFVSTQELIDLFFKGQRISKNAVKSLYLDFYQFISFALNKDQEFRAFMRDIREKYCSNASKDNEMTYIPMNFDLVLDYFIAKGKERASKEIIYHSMKMMDNTISQVKNMKTNKSFDYTILDTIDYNAIIKEFSKLFKGDEVNKSVKTIPDDLKHSVLISKSSFVITISQDNIFKTSLKKRYHITKETNDSSTTIKSKVNNHSGMNSSLSNILSHKFMNIKGKNVLPKIYQSNSSICSQRRNCSDFIPIQLYKY